MEKTLIKKLKSSLLDGKFLKTSIKSDIQNLKRLEFEVFLYALSEFKIIDTIYDLKIIKTINIGIDNALKKSKDIKIKIKKPLLSLSFYLTNQNLNDTLFILHSVHDEKLNISIIELHLCELNLEEVEHFLNELTKRNFNYLFSISISRKKLSNSAIVQIVQKVHEKINKDFIIEIDQDLSFTKKYNNDSDLQIISTADIINKDLRKKEQRFRRIPLIISCSEFSKMKILAEKCSVEFNGINLNSNSSFMKNETDFNYMDFSNQSLEKILFSLDRF